MDFDGGGNLQAQCLSPVVAVILGGLSAKGSPMTEIGFGQRGLTTLRPDRPET